MGYVMYCIVNRDALKQMNGNRGKLAAQAGHAYLHSYLDAYNRFTIDAVKYMTEGKAKKVCLVVDSVEDLDKIQRAYIDKCGASMVVDAGVTIFKGVPTTTCLGVGPIHSDIIGEDLKALKVLI